MLRIKELPNPPLQFLQNRRTPRPDPKVNTKSPISGLLTLQRYHNGAAPEHVCVVAFSHEPYAVRFATHHSHSCAWGTGASSLG